GGGVALGDDLVDGDVDVGDAGAELAVETPEGFGGGQRPADVGQAVGDGVGPEQLVDRRLAALVPDLFEPAARQGLNVVRHGGSFGVNPYFGLLGGPLT